MRSEHEFVCRHRNQLFQRENIKKILKMWDLVLKSNHWVFLEHPMWAARRLLEGYLVPTGTALSRPAAYYSVLSFKEVTAYQCTEMKRKEKTS